MGYSRLHVSTSPCCQSPSFSDPSLCWKEQRWFSCAVSCSPAQQEILLFFSWEPLAFSYPVSYQEGPPRVPHGRPVTASAPGEKGGWVAAVAFEASPGLLAAPGHREQAGQQHS